jgi:class 3 adenylate cyclase
MRCEVQRGMVVRNAEFMPEKRIEFSAGIHLGDVVLQKGDDLMGVNIAACGALAKRSEGASVS